MATVQCSWSGEPITTSWYDTSSGAGLDITNVTYDTSTGKITVSWNMYLRQYSSSSGRYNFIGGYASIGGTQVAWNHASNYGTYWTYSNWYDGKSFASGSTTFDATTSLSLYCKAMFYYGYTDTRWNNGTGCVAGSGTLYITLPSGPTINSASVSASGSTTASYSCSVSAGSSSISSYSWSIAGQSKSGSSGSVSSLSPYTTYSWSLTVTDTNSMTASTSGSFTTNRSSYPTYSASYSNISRTGATLNLSVSSNPDSWWRFHFYDQNGAWVSYTSSGATSGSYTYSGLSPNTTYTMYIRYGAYNGSDIFVQDPASSWTFTTSCNAPSSLTITRSSSTTTSISGTVSATGDSNAPITNYTLYYKPSSSSSYSAVNLGTSTSYTLNNLSVDTNYNIYFTATNAGGTSTSSTATYSTLLSSPTITTPVVSNLLPFSCSITATGSITPSRTLAYAFSKDNGSTWTSYQSSNSYDWTGLSEETSYNMKVRVKATHTGTNASDTTTDSATLVITTPADQAKIRIKKDGAWAKGKTYFKKDGAWVKAKKIYVKIDGKWVIGNNYDPGEK